MYRKLLYPAGLALLALLVFTYIFDPKLDVNGDNCYYYIFASSLAAGDGYVDMQGEATAHFPPGYPLLMVPLRLVTASIAAQKVLNLLFLFGGVLLLFYTLVGEGVKRTVAFIACAAMLVTPHLLEFSRMMMSEASCIFFMALALYAYTRLPVAGDAGWRSPWLYLFLLAASYTLYIRTQAVAFVAAFVAMLFFVRRFKLALLLSLSVFVAYLPWVVRNAMLGLEQSRYVHQVAFSRVWSTARMLVVQAIPESVLPLFRIRYAGEPSLLLYAIAFLMLVLVVYGFWQLKRVRLLLLFSLLGNIAIVSVMNTPSNYRYMVIVLPFITMGLFVGVWSVGDALCRRVFKKSFSPWFLLLLFVPTCFFFDDGGRSTLWGLHKRAHAPYRPEFASYISIGREALKLGDGCTTASRKPEFLYVALGLRGVRMKQGMNNVQILNDLLDDDVDFLLLENMGFRYTALVLYPFIKEHPQFFEALKYTVSPTNILFKFNKEAARKALVKSGYREAGK